MRNHRFIGMALFAASFGIGLLTLSRGIFGDEMDNLVVGDLRPQGLCSVPRCFLASFPIPLLLGGTGGWLVWQVPDFVVRLSCTGVPSYRPGRGDGTQRQLPDGGHRRNSLEPLASILHGQFGALQLVCGSFAVGSADYHYRRTSAGQTAPLDNVAHIGRSGSHRPFVRSALGVRGCGHALVPFRYTTLWGSDNRFRYCAWSVPLFRGATRYKDLSCVSGTVRYCSIRRYMPDTSPQIHCVFESCSLLWKEDLDIANPTWFNMDPLRPISTEYTQIRSVVLHRISLSVRHSFPAPSC